MKTRTSNVQRPTSNIEGNRRDFPTSTLNVGRWTFDVRLNSSRKAYTLIEVMVVAVVVLLMIGMALPVFRAITGSRSEAGAANQISATLSQARADAIGLQKPIGIAFIYNTSTQLENMAEVEFPSCPGWSNTTAYPQGSYVYYSPPISPGSNSPYWYCSTPQPAVGSTGTFPQYANWTRVGGPPIEIRPDTTVIPMPAGIGVQTVCNCSINTANNTRTSDGYLNLGVIIFDGQGRITCQNYGISSYSKLASASSLTLDYPNSTAGIKYSGNYGVPSQFGLVVFQHEAFNTQKSSVPDPFYTTAVASQTSAYTSGTPSPQAEENWLDQNATPLVINRYTGTLIRGE